MKIAFNPSTVAALTTPPNNKDITFDLRGRNIFARGVKFYGTDTNTWRDIKVNNVSIGSHTLDLRNGSNTTLTNTNGVVTINSTWRPVVDNLTSNSTTSSLSANQGRVLKALIDGKSDSGHNHDGRYVRYYAVTTLDCNNLAAGLTAARVSATNAAHTNHSVYLYISDIGTPFQIQIPDSNVPYIYKRYYSSGKWSGWFKLNAGYADSAGSVAWSNITGKPSSYTPSAHTHAWNSLTHSSTTENQAILTNGKANGWKLYTLNISGWNNAANNAHSHANKSVLDGITSGLVNNWNTAYTFVHTITGTDTDKVINKWDEIVNFLAGITEDNKLNTLLNSKLSVYELADKTNVGTIKNNGIYYSTTEASTGTLTNSPFTNAFALINMTNLNNNEDQLRRCRLAFSRVGDIKVSDDHLDDGTAETWYNVLTSKNSGIDGSTIKLNGTSITVYSSGTADGRYVKKSGDTMTGVLTIDTTNFGTLTIKRNNDAYGASIQFRGKSSVYGYIGLNNSTKDKQFLRWNSDISKVYTILDTSSTYTSSGKGVINGTTITQVDNATNATNSTNARKLVNWYSARPTSLNAQFGDGSLRVFHATSSTTVGKCPADATVLHLAWDHNGGWDSQLAVGPSSNRIYSRSQNNGTWQSWKTLAFTTDIPNKNSWNYDDRYYTKAESNAKYITDITTSVNKLTFTKNGSSIARTITVNNVQSLGKRSPLTERNAISGIYTYGTYSATDNLAPTNYFETLGFGEGVAGTIEIGGSWISGGKLYWRALRDYQENWFSWKTILDSSNYSSILDSRYYTESEVNSLLSKKLDRINLSVGTWNPRGYSLAADYHYNGGNLSISENGSKMYVSIDGQFYQNEGQYRVLDTSDIGSIRGGLTLYQHLSATDANWYPLVWGGSDHKNTNNSTGSLYKSYDKLSWQTSSQTLYATRLQTTDITFPNSGTSMRGIQGTVGDNDFWRIKGGATASNSGYLEIATANEGNEPIYVRQYTGTFGTIKRTLTLLDTNGFAHFPSYINIGGNENNNSSPDRVWGSNGSDSYLRSYRTSALRVAYAINANSATIASSANKLTTARNIALGTDLRGSANFDGSGNITIYANINACTVQVSSTNGLPFKRIAHFETGGSWNDNALLLYISQGYINGSNGICRVEFRTDNISSSSTSITASAAVRWLVRNGYGLDSLYAGYYVTAGKAYIDIYLKTTSGYQGTVIRVLQDSRGGINSNVQLINSYYYSDTNHKEAYNSVEAASTALYNRAYTRIVSGSDVGTVSHANSAGSVNWNNITGKPSSLPANGGNADTVDGVHMDWSTNYTEGNYLAIWDNKGNCIRPIPKGSTSVGYASSAGNASTLGGTSLGGLFTAFGNNAHNITATIGGVTKSFLVNWAADSDKLDGKHASDFATVGHNHDSRYVKIWGNVEANFNFPDGEGHSGVYMCHTTKTQSNKPETYGLLTDFSTVNGHLQFFGASSNKIYTRTYWWTDQDNFKYTDWHTLLHTGNSSVSGHTITINGTSTTWSWRPIGTGASDAAAGNHTHKVKINGSEKTIAATGVTDLGTYLTSQSLRGYVHAYNNTGTGNAVTSISIEGGTITANKGTTFLTSHQSLANYYTKGQVDAKLGKYLPLAGGTMDAGAQIQRTTTGGMWYQGRSIALLRETSANGYHALWSLKTTDGSWDFGEYNSSNWNNIPVLSYVLDSNFDKGSNITTYQIKFPLASGTIALTSNILNPTNYYWANVKISASSNSETSPTFNTAYATNYQAMYGSTSVSAAKLESANTLVYGTDTSSQSINTYLRGTNVTLQVKKGTSTNYNALQLTSDRIYCNNYCDMKYGAAVSGGNLTVQNNSYLAQIIGSKVGIGTKNPQYTLDVGDKMRAGGYIHSGHNSNDAMLLAGGGWKKLSTLVEYPSDESYIYRKTTTEYDLRFVKLVNFNNLIYVDGWISADANGKSFTLGAKFKPYLYRDDHSIPTIVQMGWDDVVTIDGDGNVGFHIEGGRKKRIGFFYTGRA